MASDRFYCYSDAGAIAPLAWRLQQEGADVVINIRERWLQATLDGIVPHTNRMPRSSDIVLFDSQNEDMYNQLSLNHVIIGSMPMLLEQPQVSPDVDAPGVSLQCEAWFNGESFVDGMFFGALCADHWLAGDLGPLTYNEWTVVWPMRSDDRLVLALFEEMEKLLANLSYMGPVRVSADVTRDSVQPVYVDTSINCYTLAAYWSLMQMPLCDVLADIAESEVDSVDVMRDQIGFSLKLSVPPYPHATPEHCVDRDKYNLAVKLEDRTRMCLHECDSEGIVAGSGIVGIATAVSSWDLVWEGARAVRELAKRVQCEDLQWRDDIASGVWDCWTQLHEMGYAGPIQQIYQAVPAAVPSSS